jgi:hypothetical protein
MKGGYKLMSPKAKPAETKEGKNSKSGYDILGPPARGGEGGLRVGSCLVQRGYCTYVHPPKPGVLEYPCFIGFTVFRSCLFRLFC